MSQVYAKLLSNKGHGHPLWIPEPNENLSYEYRQRGVSIGDVGIITPDGGFDFLFNVYLLANHPIHVNGVPEGFVRLDLDQGDVFKQSYMHPPGAIISTGQAFKCALGVEGSSKTAPIPPFGAGIIFNVRFQAETGAILWLPEGASREDLLSIDPLKTLAEVQAPLWQHFAEGRGRGQSRLFVVTGCDKTSTFAELSFMAESRACSISATVSAGLVDGKFSLEISSTDYHSYDSRVGPRPETSTHNLCVFVRGFEINPGKGLLKRIGKRVKLPRELFSLFPGSDSSGTEGCPTPSSASNVENLMGSQLGAGSLGTGSIQHPGEIHSNYFVLGEVSNIGKYALKTTGRIVAVKAMRGIKPDIDTRIRFDQELGNLVLQWQDLEYPNFTSCHGLTMQFGSIPFSMRAEGSLMRYVEAHPEVNKLQLLAQVAAGVSYLHSQGIVHADIRGSNILIGEDDSPQIMDEGLSLIVSRADFTIASLCGPCRWMPPEVLDPSDQYYEYDTYDSDSDTNATSYISPFTIHSDVYALGMTILEVFTGKAPYHHRRYDTVVILDIIRGTLPPRPGPDLVSDGLWTLLGNPLAQVAHRISHLHDYETMDAKIGLSVLIADDSSLQITGRASSLQAHLWIPRKSSY